MDSDRKRGEMARQFLFFRPRGGERNWMEERCCRREFSFSSCMTVVSHKKRIRRSFARGEPVAWITRKERTEKDRDEFSLRASLEHEVGVLRASWRSTEKTGDREGVKTKIDQGGLSSLKTSETYIVYALTRPYLTLIRLSLDSH